MLELSNNQIRSNQYNSIPTNCCISKFEPKTDPILKSLSLPPKELAHLFSMITLLGSDSLGKGRKSKTADMAARLAESLNATLVSKATNVQNIGPRCMGCFR